MDIVSKHLFMENLNYTFTFTVLPRIPEMKPEFKIVHLTSEETYSLYFKSLLMLFSLKDHTGNQNLKCCL